MLCVCCAVSVGRPSLSHIPLVFIVDRINKFFYINFSSSNRPHSNRLQSNTNSRWAVCVAAVLWGCIAEEMVWAHCRLNVLVRQMAHCVLCEHKTTMTKASFIKVSIGVTSARECCVNNTNPTAYCVYGCTALTPTVRLAGEEEDEHHGANK